MKKIGIQILQYHKTKIFCIKLNYLYANRLYEFTWSESVSIILATTCPPLLQPYRFVTIDAGHYCLN